jgi:cyclophilin family peptidyl-prolyl cis-trans isomerase
MRATVMTSLLLSAPFAAWSASAAATEVAMCTDVGAMTIELFDADAPQQVANFLRYVDDGLYSGTVFHRVVAGFVIQGGGFDRNLRKQRAYEPVANESRNGRHNERGTLAAARTSDPDSATSQFYINLANNSALDATKRDWGYTVFGRVTDGMRVADEIGRLPTGPSGPFAGEVPDPLVAITSIARLDRERLASLPGDGTAQEIRPLIAAAREAGDNAEAFAWLDQYRARCGVIDAALLLEEARLALALDRKPRARSALEEYFSGSDDSDPHYEEALALYREVTPEGLAGAQPADTPAMPAAVSQCSSPQVPQIPDGATASMDEMLAAQSAVRDFLAQSETYLKCLDQASEGDDVSDEQRAALVHEHNTTVSLMEVIAQRFNDQVHVIRDRQ